MIALEENKYLSGRSSIKKEASAGVTLASVGRYSSLSFDNLHFTPFDHNLLFFDTLSGPKMLAQIRFETAEVGLGGRGRLGVNGVVAVEVDRGLALVGFPHLPAANNRGLFFILKA